MKAANSKARKHLVWIVKSNGLYLRAYQQMIRVENSGETKGGSRKRIESKAKKLLKILPNRDGAKELEDGVMYIVVKEGDGEIPEAADMVKLNYTGTYINGEKFDSSIDKGSNLWKMVFSSLCQDSHELCRR